MGNPIPPDPADIDETKWYCVFIRSYFVFPGDEGCDGAFANSGQCCMDGPTLKDCLANRQCNKVKTICHFAAGNAQRIYWWEGPYADAAACALGCV